MGCDIHMFGEIRRGGKWVPVYDGNEDHNLREMYDGRWYRLFGALADGVRGHSGEPQRGIPEYCSLEITIERAGWGEDAHSHSWLNLGDLIRLRDTEDEDLRPSIRIIIDRLTDGEQIALDDARVVFWFDN